MSDKNKIYEITQMMGDRRIIANDINAAKDMVRSMLSEKYIRPIVQAIDKENDRVRKNPSKEAKLLSALKPFFEDERSRGIDSAINALNMANTLKGLASNSRNAAFEKPKEDFGHMTAAAVDMAIHEDGIYEIDEKCMHSANSQRLSPILLILALLSMD